MSDLGLTTSFAYFSTCHGGSYLINTKVFPQQIALECSRLCKRAFAVAKEPAQISGTSSFTLRACRKGPSSFALTSYSEPPFCRTVGLQTKYVSLWIYRLNIAPQLDPPLVTSGNIFAASTVYTTETVLLCRFWSAKVSIPFNNGGTCCVFTTVVFNQFQQYKYVLRLEFTSLLPATPINVCSASSDRRNLQKCFSGRRCPLLCSNSGLPNVELRGESEHLSAFSQLWHIFQDAGRILHIAWLQHLMIAMIFISISCADFSAGLVKTRCTSPATSSAAPSPYSSANCPTSTSLAEYKKSISLTSLLLSVLSVLLTAENGRAKPPPRYCRFSFNGHLQLLRRKVGLPKFSFSG